MQGVGFRPFVYRLATELGLGGTVWNDPRGVTLIAEGVPADLDTLARRIGEQAPALARIDGVELLTEGPAESDGPFRIAASDATPAERGRVTVDAALCGACRRELFDPADRRFGHGLINCTNCGPRYTIVRDLPYDRPLTTMAPFALCEECAREYRDPGDRRFHAQPVCCPACGPRLELVDPQGARLPGNPTVGAARVVADGGLLAMKGLGGYHLACDATSATAVDALRRGKCRDDKPFALMVPTLAAARDLVDLSEEAAALLVSPAAPILLATRRDAPGRIAPGVAPGHHRLGVMLPCTPMQHLLLAALDRPLVMTSANETDDPLVIDDEEARRRLGGFVTAFWRHDRGIERAVDDSILIDGPRGLVPVRRARGLVPTPLALPVAAPAPGLAVGGELKNTVAVVSGASAVLGQHLGDLKWSLAFARFLRTIEDLERLFDVRPRWIACDRHPDYLSTVEARRRAAEEGIVLVEVQHHHAHLAAVLAEHGRCGPCLGLLCDGVGWGDDGTAWGGEIVVGDLLDFRRLGRLRPLRLPGGDAAARETARPALAWLVDLLGDDEAAASPATRAILPDEDRRRALLSMLARNVRCLPSSGLGRLFDAAAALLAVCPENRYEAQSGMLLEAAASRATHHPPGDGLLPPTPSAGRADPDGTAPWEMDTRPLLRRVLADRASATPVAETAWLFHDAIAAGLSVAAVQARRETGVGTVALAGGVFLNTLLAQRLLPRLEAEGFEVLVPRRVPPNDGAIAYGQAAVAAARLTAAGPPARGS